MGFVLSKVLVYALHGFLGQDTDWNLVSQKLTAAHDFIAPNFFKSGFAGFDCNQVNSFEGLKIFIGYSLGGRLGLKILSEQKVFFDHYIFASTNPGFSLLETKERLQRAVADQAWAQKINPDNWPTFVNEWNSQEIFNNSTNESHRNLSDYDLDLLKQALVQDSLSQQPDYRELIKQHQEKITWVVGLNDIKFLNLAHDLLTKKSLHKIIKIDSGHRILNDNPSALAGVIQNLMTSLVKN